MATAIECPQVSEAPPGAHAALPRCAAKARKLCGGYRLFPGRARDARSRCTSVQDGRSGTRVPCMIMHLLLVPVPRFYGELDLPRLPAAAPQSAPGEVSSGVCGSSPDALAATHAFPVQLAPRSFRPAPARTSTLRRCLGGDAASPSACATCDASAALLLLHAPPTTDPSHTIPRPGRLEARCLVCISSAPSFHSRSRSSVSLGSPPCLGRKPMASLWDRIPSAMQRTVACHSGLTAQWPNHQLNAPRAKPLAVPT